MKQNWTYKKIGNICDVRTGKLDANASDENGAYPFFTCSKEPLRINTYSYDAECVLIAGNGDLNVKYYNGKFDAYQRTYILTTKNGVSDVSMQYLYLFFQLYVEILRKKSIGGVIKYIKLGDITEANLPLPPLETQSRIVSELDLLQSVIDKQKAQLKELDTLAQAIFYDMFGDPVENEKEWEVKKLGDMCEVTSSKRVYQSEWKTIGVPFYRISDFSQLIENTQFNPELYISMDKYYELKHNNQVPVAGDILVTSRGTLGNCYIVKKDDCFYFQDGMITWLKNINNRLHPLFLTFLFKNSSFRKQIEKNQSGSTVAYLSISMLKKFAIPLPPLSLQQSFAQKIEAIERQKELINQSIAEVQTLFDSRMEYYFG